MKIESSKRDRTIRGLRSAHLRQMGSRQKKKPRVDPRGLFEVGRLDGGRKFQTADFASFRNSSEKPLFRRLLLQSSVIAASASPASDRRSFLHIGNFAH